MANQTDSQMFHNAHDDDGDDDDDLRSKVKAMMMQW